MKFDVRLLLEVDEKDNLLPLVPEMYEDAIEETIRDLIYDVDSATILKIEVRQK